MKIVVIGAAGPRIGPTRFEDWLRRATANR